MVSQSLLTSAAGGRKGSAPFWRFFADFFAVGGSESELGAGASSDGVRRGR